MTLNITYDIETNIFVINKNLGWIC